MLIQNAGMAQTQSARLASDGAPAFVSAPPSNVGTQPDAPVKLPHVAAEPMVKPQPSTEQLKNVVDGINRALKQANRSVEFSVDKDTQKQVVKLVDSETGDVIRQFPTDEMLAISRAIDQVQQGLLLKQRA